jgi:hypothetical protein
MTLPYERKNAVNRTRDFLIDILWNQRDTVPEEVWRSAYQCLKHYPGELHMDMAAEQAPEVFGPHGVEE